MLVFARTEFHRRNVRQRYEHYPAPHGFALCAKGLGGSAHLHLHSCVHKKHVCMKHIHSPILLRYNFLSSSTGCAICTSDTAETTPALFPVQEDEPKTRLHIDHEVKQLRICVFQCAIMMLMMMDVVHVWIHFFHTGRFQCSFSNVQFWLDVMIL